MAKDLYPNVGNASLNRLAIVPTLAVINHAARSKLCAKLTVERYQEDAKIKDPATLEWVTRFRSAAKPHLGAMVLFMYLTGARPGEAIALQWDDVDLKRGTALIKEIQGQQGARGASAGRPGRGAGQPAPRRGARRVRLWPPELAQGRMEDRLQEGRHQAPDAALLPPRLRYGPPAARRGRGDGGVARRLEDAEQVLKTYGHAIKNPRLTDLLTGPELAHYADLEAETQSATVA
jgi:integrase